MSRAEDYLPSQAEIDAAKPRTNGHLSLPAIVDMAELYDEVVPELPEIVRGLLHQGTKMALGGGSKTCKTWVLSDLGFSVSHGLKFLDFDTVPGPVLFLNMEIHKAFFRKRMIKVAQEKGVDFKPGMLDIWNLRGFNAPYEELLPKIIDRIKLRKYVLIILDPIYKIYGSLDENKAGDISRLMTELERLSMATNAAIAFGAHFSKGNQSQKEAIDRISGSGVFARDPDTILTMTPHENAGCFVVDGTLRNMPPIKPFVVKWDYPLMVRQHDMDPAKLKKTGGRPKGYDEAQIANLLTKKPLLTSEWQKLADKELGITKASFYRALKDLKAARLVSQSIISEAWSVTSSAPPLNDD